MFNDTGIDTRFDEKINKIIQPDFNSVDTFTHSLQKPIIHSFPHIC